MNNFPHSNVEPHQAIQPQGHVRPANPNPVNSDLSRANPTEPSTTPAPTDLQNRLKRWWAVLVVGALFCLAGILQYQELATMELKGGSTSVWKPVALLYGIGGKGLVLIGFLALGGFLIYLGVRMAQQYFADKR